MNRTILTVLLPGLLLAGLTGCATTSSGGGTVADAGVRETINAWAEAMQSQQVDAAVACYSAEFQHAEWGNRDGVRDAIEQARVVGYLDGMKVDMATMQVTKDDALYRAAPVRVTGGFGEHVYAFLLRDEGGVARIVGSETIDETTAVSVAGSNP